MCFSSKKKRKISDTSHSQENKSPKKPLVGKKNKDKPISESNSPHQYKLLYIITLFHLYSDKHKQQGSIIDITDHMDKQSVNIHNLNGVATQDKVVNNKNKLHVTDGNTEKRCSSYDNILPTDDDISESGTCTYSFRTNPCLIILSIFRYSVIRSYNPRIGDQTCYTGSFN